MVTPDETEFYDMSSKHLIGHSPSKRYSAYFMADAENVTIYDDNARLWKYVLDEAGTLEQLHEIVDGQQPASADMMWLIEMLMSIDTWLEHAPHDLARHGEIGVTC